MKREVICNATKCANRKKNGECALKIVQIDDPYGRCINFEEWD